VCLVIGGSQGALGLNRLMINLVGRLKEAESAAAGWHFLWSTGPPHLDCVNRTLREMGIDPAELGVHPYIDEMARAYAAADVVVARAGALTLAELTARALAEAGAAELIEETDPRGAEKLESLLARWATRPDTLVGMGQASAALGRPEAARELASLVLALLPNPSRMS
jgi:UDP-N-acetylglucosamine--N-acetylmuramyl-(pentapeptide) pyrophosphoryl-undecaprenol N-acetylglucosamine transferase